MKFKTKKNKIENIGKIEIKHDHSAKPIVLTFIMLSEIVNKWQVALFFEPTTASNYRYSSPKCPDRTFVRHRKSMPLWRHWLLKHLCAFILQQLK